MVHPFFVRVVRNSEVVDDATSVRDGPTFSEVFPKLFPGNHWYSKNALTYLDAIATGFKCNSRTRVGHGLSEKVRDLFTSLGFDPESEEDKHVFQFWLYLTKMYRVLVEKQDPRNDNIFGFMDAFGLQETKVVIVGKDPSINIPSSGFAFHQSVCPTTEMLLKLMNVEMRMIERVVPGCAKGDVTVNFKKLGAAKSNCDLLNWINQNVLLLNSWLTYDEELWTCFTNYLVRYLSDTMPNLVFILMGKHARNKVPLIDHYKHAVIRVHHPSHIHRRGGIGPQHVRRDTAYLEYDRVLPFANANFYWYQVAREGNNNGEDGMVDWSTGFPASEIHPEWNQAHRRAYIKLFEMAIQEKERKEMETGDETLDGKICLPGTNEVALLVRQCKTGKLILRKSYGWKD